MDKTSKESEVGGIESDKGGECTNYSNLVTGLTWKLLDHGVEFCSTASMVFGLIPGSSVASIPS